MDRPPCHFPEEIEAGMFLTDARKLPALRRSYQARNRSTTAIRPAVYIARRRKLTWLQQAWRSVLRWLDK